MPVTSVEIMKTIDEREILKEIPKKKKKKKKLKKKPKKKAKAEKSKGTEEL